MQKKRFRRRIGRLFVLGILLAFAAILLSGCYLLQTLQRAALFESGYYDGMPCRQVGSTWQTEDGRITFKITDTYYPEHKETVDGREYTVMEEHWFHGEGVFVADDGKRIPIIYEETTAKEGHVVIYPDEQSERYDGLEKEINEYWGITRVCDEYIEFSVDRSVLYEKGELVRLYRTEA